MNHNCEAVRPLLLDYWKDKLSKEVENKIRDHLLDCEDCVELTTDLVLEGVEKGEIQLPESLAKRRRPSDLLQTRAQVNTTLESRETRNQSYEAYRLLLQNCPDGIFVQNGKIHYANPAAGNILGVSDPQELIGKSISAFVHPDYSRSIESMFKEIEQSSKLKEMKEFKFRRLDGQTVDAEFCGIPICWDGEPAVQIIVRDITRHKERQRYYHNILDSMKDMVATFTQDGIITYINYAGARLLGRRRKDIIGQDYKLFVTSQSLLVSEERTQRVRDGEKVPGIYKKELLRPDGQIVVVEARDRFFRQRHPKEPGFLGVYREIREHSARETLVEIEDRYWTLFQHAPVAIALFALEDGRFMNANSAYVELFGYTVDDLCRWDYRKITHLKDIAKSEELHEQLKNDFSVGYCGCRQIKKRYFRKDGTELYARLTVCVCLKSKQKCFFSMVQPIKADEPESMGLVESRFVLEGKDYSGRSTKYLS